MKYQEIANKIASQIERGVFRPGDRLPGVRMLSEQFGVSVSTVVQAQQMLEQQGKVEARPRSGFYVTTHLYQTLLRPNVTQPINRPTLVSGQNLVLRLVQAANQKGIVQLGAAVPDAQYFPIKAMNRAINTAMRKYGSSVASYAFPPGRVEFRRAVARHMQSTGCQVGPDEIVVTNGCQAALSIALQSVTKPGDIVAIESPTFYGLLQVIENLGLKALEISTDPQTGIKLDALKQAISQWPIKACALVTNFANPLGYCMPDEHKRELIAVLDEAGIPLVEDDIYGDLYFERKRPKAAKAYDVSGNVIYCSSFSKTLNPGYRIGWMVPARFYEQIIFQNYVSSLGAPTLPQLALAEILQSGVYQRHLRRVRINYKNNIMAMTQSVGRHFPQGTRVTQPNGGFVIWVELPENIDAMQLYRDAFENNISIAPGSIFSPTQKYGNCIRLNAAQLWDAKMEKIIATLGKLARIQKGHISP